MVNGGVADSGGDCVVKRPSPRRRFSRVLKAVLFDSMKVSSSMFNRFHKPRRIGCFFIQLC